MLMVWVSWMIAFLFKLNHKISCFVLNNVFCLLLSGKAISVFKMYARTSVRQGKGKI